MANSSIFSINKVAINAGDMSANITSSIVDISELTGYAVHAIWSGTSPVGTITVLGSNDRVNFASVATQAVSGNTGQYLTNQPNIHYKFVEVTYTFTSGTGSLTVYISGKGI